jgi:hypothetical protein
MAAELKQGRRVDRELTCQERARLLPMYLKQGRQVVLVLTWPEGGLPERRNPEEVRLCLVLSNEKLECMHRFVLVRSFGFPPSLEADGVSKEKEVADNFNERAGECI